MILTSRGNHGEATPPRTVTHGDSVTTTTPAVTPAGINGGIVDQASEHRGVDNAPTMLDDGVLLPTRTPAASLYRSPHATSLRQADAIMVSVHRPVLSASALRVG